MRIAELRKGELILTKEEMKKFEEGDSFRENKGYEVIKKWDDENDLIDCISFTDIISEYRSTKELDSGGLWHITEYCIEFFKYDEFGYEEPINNYRAEMLDISKPLYVLFDLRERNKWDRIVTYSYDLADIVKWLDFEDLVDKDNCDVFGVDEILRDEYYEVKEISYDSDRILFIELNM